VIREDGLVPTVSAFYGIVIEMYFGDHPPPHFHARYYGDEALIVIETGEVYAGRSRLARSGSRENGLSFTDQSCSSTGSSPKNLNRPFPSRYCRDRPDQHHSRRAAPGSLAAGDIL
jgi:hypothetical protein